MSNHSAGLPATLVCIDMQRVFQDPESQWYVGDYEPAAVRVAELAQAYAGDVVWTRFVRDPAESGSWKDYYERWDRCREAPESPEWDVTLEVGPEDRVLSLPTFSKWGRELAEMTAETPQLIVCGVATDCCVISTVLGAVDAGKHVTVVTDACAGATTEVHDQALSLMGMLSPMVTLTTTAELLAQR